MGRPLCVFDQFTGELASDAIIPCGRPAKFVVGRFDDSPICEECIRHESLQDAHYGELGSARFDRLPEAEWAKVVLEFRVGEERRLVGLVPAPTPRQSEQMRREHQETMARLYETACAGFGITRATLAKFGAALTPEGAIDHELEHQDRNARALQMALEKTGTPRLVQP